jgi:hypothetical protein
VAEVEDRDGAAASELRPPAAYRKGAERLVAAVADGVLGQGEWKAKMSAGLDAGLRLLAADHELARLLLVEPFTAPDLLRVEHERSVTRLAEALRPPPELTGGDALSDEILRLQAHGLVSYLSGRVLAGEAKSLADLHDQLLRFLLAQLPSAGIA